MGALALALATASGAALSIGAMASAAHAQTGQPAAGDAITESAAINAAWKSWREALDARAAFLDPRELSAKLEQYRQWLLTLDRDMPSVVGARPGAPAWAAALAAEAKSQRETVLRKVLSRIEPQAPALDDPAVQAEVEAAKRSLNSWRERTALLAQDLMKIEAGMNEARTLEEGGPDSIRSLTEKWVLEGLTRQPGVRTAVAPVLDRVEAMEAIERESDHAALLRIAREAPAAEPEKLFSAWRRLANRGQSVWPIDETELAAEVSLRPALEAAAKRLSAAERRDFLNGEIDAEQSRRVTRLLSAAIDDSTIAAADKAVHDLAIDEHQLDGRIRYNLLLGRLKRAVSAPGTTDDRARAAARDFVTSARALQGGVAYLSGVSGVVSSIDAIAQGLEIAPAALDGGRTGPAAMLGAGTEDGPRLTFTLPPRSGVPETRIEFILVGEGAAATYVTTAEVSVGQVAAIVAARNAERALTEVLPEFKPLEDSRIGPRSWTWRRDEFGVPQIVASPSWMSPVALLAGIDYPPDLAPAAPSFESPMQHVAAAPAAYIASLAGCRFPTIGEMNALLKEHAPELRRELANLRDSTWQQFSDHMASRKQAGRWSEAADAGAFVPAGSGMTALLAHPWNDGWIWFAPAKVLESETVSHVLGNVAEFVTTEPWKLPQEPQAVQDFVAGALGHLRVLGGSALSDTGIDVRVPQELDPIDAMQGFSDVGFRLAFGAENIQREQGGVGRHIVEVLNPTPYIKPR